MVFSRHAMLSMFTLSLLACAGTDGMVIQRGSSVRLAVEEAATDGTATDPDPDSGDPVPDANSDDAGPSGPDLSLLLPMTTALMGTVEPLRAWVAPDESGFIWIPDYPKLYQLQIAHAILPTGFPREGISQGFCDTMRSLAKLVGGGGSLASVARERLRQSTVVDFQIRFAPPLYAETRQALLGAARDLGTNAPSFDLQDPLMLRDATLSLEVDKGAIVNLIGDTAALGGRISCGSADAMGLGDCDGQFSDAGGRTRPRV